MTVDHDVAETLSSAPGERELHRQLMEQFYQDSVSRYGDDSEQARTFSLLLGADAVAAGSEQ